MDKELKVFFIMEKLVTICLPLRERTSSLAEVWSLKCFFVALYFLFAWSCVCVFMCFFLLLMWSEPKRLLHKVLYIGRELVLCITAV